MAIRKRRWKSHGVERSAWVVDYTDSSGMRRLKTFDTKKAADAWSVTAHHEIQQGTHTPARISVTVREAYERWIKNCEAEGLEYGTMRQRRQHLRLHIDPFLGGERLSTLTMPRVYQFDAELRDNGRSIAMRRKVMTNLKTAISFAQSRGLVAQNVARGVKIKADTRTETTGPLREGVDFPSKAELKAMIETATGRWRPFIITAVFTGMRASELRGLPWANVDLENGIIHVRQRADAWRRIGPPKSKAGARDIPLTPMVANALRQWRAKCPDGELDLVFPNTLGNVEGLQNIWERFFKPLQLACAISRAGKDGKAEPKYGMHALRHAAASLFIAYLGWTPKRVQTVMGHSSIRMTYDLYGHLFEDREADREAMKKIEAAIVAA
jgi:integrase